MCPEEKIFRPWKASVVCVTPVFAVLAFTLFTMYSIMIDPNEAPIGAGEAQVGAIVLVAMGLWAVVVAAIFPITAISLFKRDGLAINIWSKYCAIALAFLAYAFVAIATVPLGFTTIDDVIFGFPLLLSLWITVFLIALVLSAVLGPFWYWIAVPQS